MASRPGTSGRRADDDLAALHLRNGQRARKASPLRRIDEAGIEQLEMCLQLAEVLAHQRIGDRDRRERNARVMAPSASSWCSMALPDRIIIGRSGPRLRCASACAMAADLLGGLRIADRRPALLAGAPLRAERSGTGVCLGPLEQMVVASGPDRAAAVRWRRSRMMPSDRASPRRSSPAENGGLRGRCGWTWRRVCVVIRRLPARSCCFARS